MIQSPRLENANKISKMFLKIIMMLTSLCVCKIVSAGHRALGSVDRFIKNLFSFVSLHILVSLSYGRGTLTPGDWEDAKRMERERKERAASLPARSRPYSTLR